MNAEGSPETKPEIDPEAMESARGLIEAFGFGDYADVVVSYGGQELTIVEGLARHWDISRQLDGAELFTRVESYVKLAQEQA